MGIQGSAVSSVVTRKLSKYRQKNRPQETVPSETISLVLGGGETHVHNSCDPTYIFRRNRKEVVQNVNNLVVVLGWGGVVVWLKVLLDNVNN